MTDVMTHQPGAAKLRGQVRSQARTRDAAWEPEEGMHNQISKFSKLTKLNMETISRRDMKAMNPNLEIWIIWQFGYAFLFLITERRFSHNRGLPLSPNLCAFCVLLRLILPK